MSQQEEFSELRSRTVLHVLTELEKLIPEPGTKDIISLNACLSDAINVTKRYRAPIYVSKQIVLNDAVKILYGLNKLRGKKPTYDVFLDSAIDGADVLTEDVDFVAKMNLAVKDERYSDAGVFGPKTTMNALKLSKTIGFHSPLFSRHLSNTRIKNLSVGVKPHRRTRFVLRASVDGQEDKKTSEKRSFLTLEEAGLVEMSGLSSHEGFLCRLTISSLNLLRVIGEQEGCSIEELNAGKVCDWFLKDKLKREQNLDAVLQWDESNFPI
ncbi:hypothetical protein L2E82_40131 [Cichorium intybus]|uniref:Uncharacterized protein n=1 Tax=Cichorium intybus TaxID=13427 RepID=A0ACB9AKI7_CICIN|nr:hypothetical protein L2E82_40131 [Cichorium intybus]